MVVENLTATLINIGKGVKVAQVIAANLVPPVEVTPNTLEKLDEIQGIQQTRMMVEQKQKLLIQQLALSGLDKWSGRSQAAASALLAEYHHIFPWSLES